MTEVSADAATTTKQTFIEPFLSHSYQWKAYPASNPSKPQTFISYSSEAPNVSKHSYVMLNYGETVQTDVREFFTFETARFSQHVNKMPWLQAADLLFGR